MLNKESFMRKGLVLLAVACLALALSVSAQEAEPNSVTVSDQVSTNGMALIDSVTIDTPGFVAIHADEGGMPGHVVGVAPVPAGTSQGVLVMIDGAMSTPTLYAQLHVDDNTAGMFEFGKVPGADAPVSEAQPFSVAAIVAFNQQPFMPATAEASNQPPVETSVIIASAIIDGNGWMVVHADNEGQPGPVLGFSPLVAGTNAPVTVVLDGENITPVVWPMLHVDDGTVSEYEFDGSSGLDSPVAINGVVATAPITLTDAPTLLLTDNTPLQSAFIPSVLASQQELADAGDGSATMTVDMVSSPAQGFVDVHADMGHPAVSLGHTLVDEGENPDVSVTLMPPQEGSMLGITPQVWPMLHLDTDQDGEYRYLQIPGVDLPVVYNGAVVTLRVDVSGDMVVAPPVSEMTPEATDEGGAVPTTVPEQPTEEATMEATAEPLPEGTAEVTDEAPQVPMEPTEPAAEATEGA
jgi:hypothetical protein